MPLPATPIQSGKGGGQQKVPALTSNIHVLHVTLLLSKTLLFLNLSGMTFLGQGNLLLPSQPHLDRHAFSIKITGVKKLPLEI